MPIFIKLFVISIVAKSLFGFFKRFKTNFVFFDFSFFSISTSFGAREKKATSAPEISAEQNNNRIMIIKLSTIPIDIGSKVISKKRLSKSGLNSSSNFGVIYLER